MRNDELLDSWVPNEPGDKQPDKRAGDSVRPDPIDMLFSGVPEPVIVREEEELAIQRAPSGRLALNMLIWFLAVIGLIILAYRVWWEYLR